MSLACRVIWAFKEFMSWSNLSIGTCRSFFRVVKCDFTSVDTLTSLSCKNGWQNRSSHHRTKTSKWSSELWSCDLTGCEGLNRNVQICYGSWSGGLWQWWHVSEAAKVSDLNVLSTVMHERVVKVSADMKLDMNTLKQTCMFRSTNWTMSWALWKPKRQGKPETWLRRMAWYSHC